MPSPEVRAEVAEVLADLFPAVQTQPGNPHMPYWLKKADALAPLLDRIQAEAEQRGRREALEETADAWQINGWASVLLPKPTPPAVPVIAYANRVTDWLRDRAETTP